MPRSLGGTVMAEKETSTRSRVGHVKDARGKNVTLIDPFLMHKLNQRDTIPADSLGRIARDIGSGWAKQGVWIFSYVWSVAFVLMIAAHFIKWGGGLAFHPRELRLWLVLLALFVVNCVIVWFISRHARLQRVCRILLEYLRCPHCGYDLRLLPTDPEDGATVCPECGCTWKLDEAQSVDRHGSADSGGQNEHGSGIKAGDDHG